jgi:2-aminoadipate transaminase
MRGSALRIIFKETRKPGMISLAGGTPAPEVFPVEDIAAASERAIIHKTVDALQYGLTEGYVPLRQFLADRMNGIGFNVGIDNIQITVGSQQAIDIVGRMFLDPGTLVAIEDPTYMSAITAWAPLRPRYLPIKMDEDGIDVDALQAALERGEKPAFLYTISAFQNPTGVTISMEKRRRLIELAARHALPIVEDDPYGELVFEGKPMTPLAALDCQMHGELRHVIYMSTFSKLVSPGLRTAWAVGPKEVITKMGFAKQGMDLHAAALSQVIVHEVCADGLLERHLPLIRKTYKARRDAMLESLEKYMPAGFHWTKPAGGMFVWLTMPDSMSAEKLVSLALARNVAFVPGASFYAIGGPANTARLSFANPTPDMIRVGVKRLAEAIEAY